MFIYNFLSKLAYIFIAPENWILLLLFGLLITKSGKVKRSLTVIILLMLFFFGNEFIFKTFVNNWQPKAVTISEGVSYEAGIVLGGSSSFDKYGRGYLNFSADRFIETCLLYKTKKIKRIIISGGSNGPDQLKDADFQFKKMVEMGIPPQDIIIEDSSRSTFENAAFTKIKIDSLGLKPPFVLITSAMHMPRAQMVFTKAGVSVIPFPCDYHVIESKTSFSGYFIPGVSTIFSWSSFLKEIVGIMGYKVFKKA